MTRHGKTCLGEAAKIGSINAVKLLIDATASSKSLSQEDISKTRRVKSHKRKLKSGQYYETVVKWKNLNDRSYQECHLKHSDSLDCDIHECSYLDNNQGYFVYIHSDGSSSDESRISNTHSPIPTPPLPTSPHIDLEWDEEIGCVAPTTREDETWSSIYRLYLFNIQWSN